MAKKAVATLHVKKIVTDLKGSIRAESELGAGTTFIITLPLLES